MFFTVRKAMTQGLVAALLLGTMTVSITCAQSCKPNVSRQDKITKQRIDIWTQVLNSTSFGASVIGTTDVGITATVGRYGTVNAVNLQIQKKEESRAKVDIESPYRAAVGKPFYFGFKSGPPLAFMVTEVSNAARVGGVITSKAITTVVLSAVVSDADLLTLRETLTTQPIDAVRIELAGDLRIEKSVSEGNGRKMMENFQCFFQYLASANLPQAIPPSAPEATAVQASALKAVSGRYVNKNAAGDSIELSPNGSFVLSQSGQIINGTWKIQDGAISLASARFRGQPKAKVVGETLVDDQGITWERPTESQSAAGSLTVDQIIQMVGAKLPDDIIISAIRGANKKIEVTPAALIKLKAGGVSDDVLRAITRP